MLGSRGTHLVIAVEGLRAGESTRRGVPRVLPDGVTERNEDRRRLGGQKSWRVVSPDFHRVDI